MMTKAGWPWDTTPSRRTWGDKEGWHLSSLTPPCPLPPHQLPTYHMVALEGFHDGGLVEELDALPHGGQLVDSLQGHLGLLSLGNQPQRQPLVHHAEGALPQLPDHRDLLP